MKERFLALLGMTKAFSGFQFLVKLLAEFAAWKKSKEDRPKPVLP
jgi:hypothetical protein